MALIKSRKHAQSRFHLNMSTALAVMLLPVAAHAADAAPAAAPAAEPQASAKSQTLPEVRVQGSTENDFKADKASSPKYTEKLVDTPQTITVIKRELMEQQGATTLTEALRNTPGVGAFFLGENGSTNTGDAIYMRGFDTSGSIFVDGVRDVGSISRDVFNIEQIDVLKGPAGSDTGRGAPTGSINLGSKQAKLEDGFSSIITAGSGKQKRATADWNKVIDADRGIAFRLNVMDQDSGNAARDVVTNKRWGIAPTIAFGLNGPTRVYLNYLHVKQDNIPDGGVPTIGLPGYSAPTPAVAVAPAVQRPLRPVIGAAPMVDSSNFYGSTSDHDNVKVDMFTVRVEHDFSPTAKFQNTSRYGKTQQDYLLSAFMGSDANIATPVQSDLSTWTLARTNRTVKDQENKILTNQSTITADLETGVLKHTFVAGLELTSEKQTTYTYTAASLGALTPANLYNPDPNVQPTNYNPTRNGGGADVTIDTQSVYLFDTIKFGDQWMFNLGGRFDHFDIDYRGVSILTAVTNGLPIGTAVPTSLTSSDTLFTGKASVVYKPTPNSSVYALYASSKQPPGGATFVLSAAANSAGNANYEPQETKTKEIGTKWDFLDQKLSFTAALYRTDISNEVEQDPTNATQYFQNGKKRVEGVELGVTGEVMRNWLVSAGYTHMKTSVEAGKVVTANGDNNLSYTPKDAFTSWTSYTLPFGLKVGGGVRYVGKLLRGTDGATGTPAFADSYWVADAMAAYPVSKNVTLQLNVFNLADKEYVSAINKSGYRYTPGQPRSASLTANIAF